MGDVVRIDAMWKAKAPALAFGHATEGYLTARKAAEAWSDGTETNQSREIPR